MGSNMIIAIVVGAILVIVGFSLWPVLNGATNSLYSYFRDSCDDGNGNKFTKMYLGDQRPGTAQLPGSLNPPRLLREQERSRRRRRPNPRRRTDHQQFRQQSHEWPLCQFSDPDRTRRSHRLWDAGVWCRPQQRRLSL